MKLNWVTFKVRDLEKSLYFYNGLLNLKIAAKFGTPEHQIVMLGNENEPKIELIYEPGNKTDLPGNGVSVGLESENLDDLVKLLRGNGYALQGPVSPSPGIRFYFVHDPDGYTIQLVEQK